MRLGSFHIKRDTTGAMVRCLKLTSAIGVLPVGRVFDFRISPVAGSAIGENVEVRRGEEVAREVARDVGIVQIFR
jgi:hypothetical protein